MSRGDRWWVMSSGVALAVCCWLLADLFWRVLFPQSVTASLPALSQPLAVNAPITLFGQPGQAAASSSSALGSSDQLRGWQLLGTLITHEQAMALVHKGQNGALAWVRPGEALPEGYRVTGLTHGRLTLMTAQGERQLLVPGEQKLPLSAQPLLAAAGAQSMPSASGVLASARAVVRQNPAEVMKWMRFEPVWDSGKLAGVVLSPAAGQEGLYQALGLQEGDLLMAINGVPVQGWMSRMGELPALLDGAGARIQVQRAGQPVEWTLAW